MLALRKPTKLVDIKDDKTIFYTFFTAPLFNRLCQENMTKMLPFFFRLHWHRFLIVFVVASIGTAFSSFLLPTLHRFLYAVLQIARTVFYTCLSPFSSSFSSSSPRPAAATASAPWRAACATAAAQTSRRAASHSSRGVTRSDSTSAEGNASSLLSAHLSTPPESSASSVRFASGAEPAAARSTWTDSARN